MRKLLLIFMAIALVALPSAVFADDESGVDGDIYVGGWDVSEDGAQEVVSEYSSTEGGVEFDLDISNYMEGGGFDFESWFVDGDEQEHALDFEVGRMVRSHTSYTKFNHRLQHDSLDHLQTAIHAGRTVKRTDLAEGDEFGITYSFLEHRTDLQFEGLSNMTIGLIYEQHQRKGVKQMTTVSHCESCHVVGQSRAVDEDTQDIGLDLTFDWDGGQVKASYVTRELTQGARAGSLHYDNAIHPEKQIEIFDNRLQFDDDEGVQDVDLQPDITKDTAKIGLSMPDLGGLSLNAGGVFTTTENEYTGVGTDYSGYLVNIARPFGKGWDIRWRGRYYSMDTDDIWVEVNDRVGTAGPHNGVTYKDAYGIETDFLRQSTLNRDVLESKLDLGYKISKKAGSLRFTWDYDQVDRDYVYVTPGSTKTTTQALGVKWTARPMKGVRLTAAYEHGMVDDPYLSQNTTFSTLYVDGTGSPFSSPQYFEFHDARIGDPTSVPEDWDELELRATWKIGQQNMSAMYKWWDGENSAGDLTDWSNNNQIANITWWMPSSETVYWNLAYTWNQQERNFPITVPIYDG